MLNCAPNGSDPQSGTGIEVTGEIAIAGRPAQTPCSRNRASGPAPTVGDPSLKTCSICAAGDCDSNGDINKHRVKALFISLVTLRAARGNSALSKWVLRKCVPMLAFHGSHFTHGINNGFGFAISCYSTSSVQPL